MKLFLTPKSFVPALLAFIMVCGTARAQYTITGLTPGGGNNIVGNGTITVPVTPYLSGFGFNTVTLNLGSLVSVPGADGLAFTRSDDTVFNNGTITGAAGFNAVSFFSTSALSNEAVTNNGTVNVTSLGDLAGATVYGNNGNNLTGGNIGSAIGIASGAGVSGISITNSSSSTITGGSIGAVAAGSTIYGNNGGGDVGGNIATAIAISSGGGISGVSITNGSNSTVAAGSIGALSAGSSIYGNYILGSPNAGGNVATGIAITSIGSTSGVTLVNNGSITGGNIGVAGMGPGGLSAGSYIYGNYDDPDNYGGNISTGVAITSLGALNGLTLANNGSIGGGSIGALSAGSYIYGNYDDNDIGGNISTGVAIDSSVGGGISGLSFTNKGVITGGNIGNLSASSYIYGNDGADNAGGNIAAGVAITSGAGISGLSFTSSGPVSAGSFGGLTGGSYIYGNHSGSNEAGGNIATGITIDANTSITTLSFTSSGAINGGGIGGLSGSSYIYGNDNGSNEAGGNIATGIAIDANTSITTLTFTSSGAINGGGIGGLTGGSYIYGNNSGDNEAGGNIATGIAIDANTSINSLSFTSNGTVNGGSIGGIGGSGGANTFIYGNDSDNYEAGGNIATGIAIDANTSITSLSFTSNAAVNAGSIGGLSSNGANTYSYIYGNTSNNEAGGNVAAGIAIGANTSISSLSLTSNAAVNGGSIGGLSSSGGQSYAYIYGNVSDNEAGGNTATGIAIGANTSINSLALTNNGAVNGGSIGGLSSSGNAYSYIYGNTGNNEAGGNIATGIAIDANTSISSLALTNNGTVNGGSIGGLSNLIGNAFSYIYGNASAGNEAGGNIATGIAIESNSAMNGLSLTNNGTVNGGSIGGLSGGDSYLYGNSGSHGEAGGNIATGIAIDANSSISSLALTNNGTINGGSIGNLSGGSFISGNDDSNEVGGNIGTGIAINSAGAINGLVLKNYGTISGGSIGVLSGGSTIYSNNSPSDVGGDILSGVSILSGAASSGNNLVVNFGTIQGGNSASGNAGMGISANTGNLTINNWGAINAGGGSAQAGLPAGYPAVAVSVSGNNNTINLNGHSSVNGTLQGANSGVNNVLNLNFTGMSPAAIASLKSQLSSQGWPGTNDFTGTFTVRGVTYYVDPLVLNLNVSSYQLQGVTPNQAAIGASLDSVTSNPALGSSLGNLYNAIDLSGNVPAALDALSPQKYQAFGDLAIQNTTAMVQNLDARLNNIRDGSESIDTSGLGGNGGTTTAQAAESELQATAGYSKEDGKESKQVVQAAPPERRWGMFATGDGLFFRGSARDVNVQGVKSNDAGTLAGIDAKIGDHAVGGAFFSYNNSAVNLGSDQSHATIESYSGGLYGSYHQDGFFANGVAAYTHNHYSTDRDIVFPGFASDATGGTSGNQESVNLDGGYDWHATDRVTLGPIAGLQYVHLDVDGFNETGAGAANLAISSQNMNSLQSRVGGRVDYHLLTSETSSFAAELHAAWQHEFLDDSRGIGASFIGDGLTPFTMQTSSPLRDAAVVGLGLNFTFHDRLTLFADYELLMWRTSYFEQTINGGGRISF